MLNIDYGIMSQYFSLTQEEKTPEEKKDLIRKIRGEMRLGNTAGPG